MRERPEVRRKGPFGPGREDGNVRFPMHKPAVEQRQGRQTEADATRDMECKARGMFGNQDVKVLPTSGLARRWSHWDAEILAPLTC
jgi:hypothetical protein